MAFVSVSAISAVLFRANHCTNSVCMESNVCMSICLAVSPEVHVCSAAHLNFAFDCIICYCFGELWESIERTFQKMKSNDRIAQATSGLLIVPTKTIACIL